MECLCSSASTAPTDNTPQPSSARIKIPPGKWLAEKCGRIAGGLFSSFAFINFKKPAFQAKSGILNKAGRGCGFPIGVCESWSQGPPACEPEVPSLLTPRDLGLFCSFTPVKWEVPYGGENAAEPSLTGPKCLMKCICNVILNALKWPFSLNSGAFHRDSNRSDLGFF